MQLHLQHDGSFLFREAEGIPPKVFHSLLEALSFAHDLSPDSDHRLTVYDAEGREIIETFA